MKLQGETHVQRLDRDVPHHESADARPAAVDDDMIIYLHALCPADLVVLVVLAIRVILQPYRAGSDGLDGDI